MTAPLPMAEGVATNPAARDADAEGADRFHRFSQEEYFRMAEVGILEPEDRTELIEGYIVEMVAQNAPHRVAVGKISQTFNLKLAERAYWVQPQSTLPIDDRNVPEPDIAILGGTPDDLLEGEPEDIPLIIEVADTSLEKDRTVKLACYAANQIPEYWIVNLQACTLEVYRDPADREYRERRTLSFGDTVTPLFDTTCTISVTDLLPSSR